MQRLLNLAVTQGSRSFVKKENLEDFVRIEIAAEKRYFIKIQ